MLKYILFTFTVITITVQIEKNHFIKNIQNKQINQYSKNNKNKKTQQDKNTTINFENGDKFDYNEFMKKGGSRIPPQYRKFNSTVINQEIETLIPKMKDKILGQIFEQCFPNTLDTTVNYFTENPEPDTFVITGDIPAMWQRDSTNQVFPYLQFVNKEEKLKNMIKGLINRQAKNVLIDPYANAYNFADKISEWYSDYTKMKPMLWERKWEIDSLGAFLKLSTEYMLKTQDYDSFLHNNKNKQNNKNKNNNISNQKTKYILAIEKVLQTLEIQQEGSIEQDKKGDIPYKFQRVTEQPSDTLQFGRGQNALRTGMIRSGFRPSDDACTFPFNIPGNAMLKVYLEKLVSILSNQQKQQEFQEIINKAQKIAKEIQQGITTYGITQDNKGNQVFAYEVDGYGNVFKMDDANIPSLLSLPFLGYISNQEQIYKNTRNLVLNKFQNPYFYEGKEGEGIGGPHVGDLYIWPMSIIMRAITSDNDEEIVKCLQTLKKTTANTYFMHESFYAENSFDYTRPWFAWANTLFGELILKIKDERPHLILKEQYLHNEDNTINKQQKSNFQKYQKN